MTNMRLLQILRLTDDIHLFMATTYKNSIINSTKELSETSKFTSASGYKLIGEFIQEECTRHIQNECTHPIGVKVGDKVYCPICEKELSPESVITIEKEAGGHNIGFIREKIAEVLPLIPEVTPAQIAEYVDRELKTFSR